MQVVLPLHRSADAERSPLRYPANHILDLPIPGRLTKLICLPRWVAVYLINQKLKCVIHLKPFYLRLPSSCFSPVFMLKHISMAI